MAASATSFAQIIKPALVNIKWHLGRILVFWLGLSLAHSLILVLIGPLLMALMNGHNLATISIAALLPKHITFLPQAWLAQTIPVATLKVWLPVAILVVGLLKSLATYGFQINQHYTALYVANTFRQKLFAKILAKDFEDLQNKSPGSWMSLIVNDVHFLQSRFSDLCLGVLRDLGITLAAIGTLALIAPQAAIVLVVAIPLLALGLGRISKNIAYFARKWQADLAELARQMLSIRRRLHFVKAQGGEAFEKAFFDHQNQAYFDNIKKSLRIRSGFAPWLEFVGIALFVGVLWLQSRGLLFATLSGPEIFQIFAALGMLLRPMRNIGEQLSKFQETRGALQHSLEVFAETPRAKASSQVVGEPLAIASLDFGYRNRIIGSIANLKPNYGRALAIIGPSGSGKSTLLKTLAGLIPAHNYEGGTPLAEWQQQSSYVSQKPFLFDGTLRDNLTYGIPGTVSDAQIIASLEQVGLSALSSRNNGLDAQILGLKPGFSGGQIQRLAIARLILSNRKIWLLDEPTAAVDAKTETSLLNYLLAAARTSKVCLVTVTHRLSHLDRYDEVWFLENGKLLAAGSPAEVAQLPAYKDFQSV